MTKNFNHFPDKLVHKITALNGVYFEAFQNYYEFNIENGNYKINSLSIYLQPLALLFLALRTMILTRLKIKSLKFNRVQEVKFTFISACDHAIRAENLYYAADNIPFQVLYLPALDFHATKKHYNSLKGKSNVTFTAFSITQLLRYIYLYITKTNHFYTLFRSKEIDREHKRFLIKVLLQFLLYDSFSRSFLNKNIPTSSEKWILDYEKGNMLPFIMQLNKLSDNTFHLQHGIMQKTNKFYLPVISHFVLCCSEREKKLYISSGLSNDKVILIGAPLQSINFNSHINNSINIQSQSIFDLVLLLTETENDAIFLMQKRLLQKLSVLANEYKILCRYRPASKKKDTMKLGTYTSYFSISEKHSLSEDINRAKLVVSFSFDAVFEAIVRNKEIVIVHNQSCIDSELFSIVKSDINGVLNEIQSKLNGKMLHKKELYIDLLGNPNPDLYKVRFQKIINILKV